MFKPYFTAPTWQHVLVPVAGAVLAPGKRTVTQVLRVMGLADDAGFAHYHEVLNRARWDAHALARQLLLHLLDRLQPFVFPTRTTGSGVPVPVGQETSQVLPCSFGA